MHNEGVLWDPPRVPTYYNFAWVPHTFGGLTFPDPHYFAHRMYAVGKSTLITLMPVPIIGYRPYI